MFTDGFDLSGRERMKIRFRSAASSAKDRLASSAAFQRVKNTSAYDAVDGFINSEKVIKYATAGLGLEAFISIFGTSASALAMIATGHPVIAVLMVLGYLVGISMRFIVAHAAVAAAH